MPLHIIGLGLADEKDITVKGLECVKQCTHVFLEMYTSILQGISLETLESFYGKKVVVADRDLVESGTETILDLAVTEPVAFLVVGDPFGATTHTDLVLRAKERSIPVQIIHNASIMNAMGASGLQLYRFGQSISLCFFTETWRPDSFYEKLAQNRQLGLHSLCLLDIKVKEQSEENLARGRKIYEPPRFMTVNQAVEQLLEVENKFQKGVCTSDCLAVGMARVGACTQKIVAGPLSRLAQVDFGAPLHTLLLAGQVHELEVAMLRLYAENFDEFDACVKNHNVSFKTESFSIEE